MPQLSLPCPSDFELLVDFDYQAAEPAERGPEARYPGCPESIEIEHVTLNGLNVTSLLSEAQLQEIEQAIWDYLDAQDAGASALYDAMQDHFLEPF